MKKIFILLFSIGLLNSAFAQRNDNKDWRYETRDNNYDRSRDNGNNNGRYSNSAFSLKEKNQQIAQIVREYNDRIKDVKRDRRFSRSEKNRQIDFLERQRDYKINQVNSYYAQRSNGRYDDRTARNNRNW